MNKDLQNALESIGNAKTYYYDMEGQQESTIKSVYNVEYQILEKNIEHLQQENESLKETIKTQKKNYRDCNIERLFSRNQAKTFEEENEKLTKAIDFLKLNFDISLDSKLRISDGSECVQTFIIDLPENTTIDEMFEIIEEVLGV